MRGRRAAFGLFVGMVSACVSLSQAAIAEEKSERPPSSQAAPPKSAGQKVANSNPKLALPDADKIVLLIRTSLLSVNDALQTGNYTVLRDKAAPAFRDGSTAISLGKSLEALAETRIDLSAVAIIAPQLTELPTISEEGVLRLKGYFPGEPVGIGFELSFQAITGAWRLLGLNIGLVTVPKAAASAKPDVEKPKPKP